MNGNMNSGVSIIDIGGSNFDGSLREDLVRSLNQSPQDLPTLLLYNEKGLRLFEDITYLDEYYLTNGEIEVLTKHADLICEYLPAGSRLIELGSGNLRKVNILLKAFEKAQKDIDYYALDVSLPELKRTFAELKTSDYKYVRFHALHGTYDDGLVWIAETQNNSALTAVISLGSSLGNFTRSDASKFLASIEHALSPGDLIITGLDTCENGSKIFHAYNDREGVTEKFYRNGLDHASFLLGYPAFKQEDWAIEGIYDESDHAHKAFVIALKDVKTKDFQVLRGTKIQFEHSDKFTPKESDTLLRDAGLVPLAEYSNDSHEHVIRITTPSVINLHEKVIEYAKTPTPSVDDWRRLWSVWDTVTKAMVPREELWNKPIQLRNDLIFYLGHIPAFAEINYLKATDESPCGPEFYHSIFERGIDPDVDDPSNCHSHSEIPKTWPPLQDILQYQQRVRTRILAIVKSGKVASNYKLARVLWLAYEHEAMHLETFLYMLLQSERVLPPPGQSVPDFDALAKTAAEARTTTNKWHQIPATKLNVGLDDPESYAPPDRYFGWDIERPSRTLEVAGFEAQSRPISIGEYAKFLEETKSNNFPASWVISKDKAIIENDTNGYHNENARTQESISSIASAQYLENKAIRTVYGAVPLKYAVDWPIMASYDELAAFAVWSGGRIPTYAEIQSIYRYVESNKADAENTPSSLVPAVNGHLSNEGVEETPPSIHSSNSSAGTCTSSALDPSQIFVDLTGKNVGFKSWCPTPVTGNNNRLCGQGDAGGLWEWTSSPLTAHDGYQPMPLYPGYSYDFFDGKHNVCVGGSWATVPRIAGRKSFVNWYQRNYPFVWCTARLVRDVA